MEALSFTLIGLEFAVLIIGFTLIYNPLKKKEEKLKKNKKIDKIKKFFLKNSLKEIRPFLKILLGIFIISLISLFLSYNDRISSIAFMIIIMGFILSFILNSFLFSVYVKVYRNRENIFEAKNLKEILEIVGIKKKYLGDIISMIDIAWKRKETDKELAAWFLDSLDYDEERIKS